MIYDIIAKLIICLIVDTYNNIIDIFNINRLVKILCIFNLLYLLKFIESVIHRIIIYIILYITLCKMNKEYKILKSKN